MKIRLHEIGPRMTLRLHKIEDGFLKGNILYNRVVKKSEKEKVEQNMKIRDKKKLKIQRK